MSRAEDSCGPDRITRRLVLYTIRLRGIRMAKSRLAGFGALCCGVAPLGAFGLASVLIGRHVQCPRRLAIAGSGGKLSLGPGQGSLLGGKSGTGEQRGNQDTKHKAHDVTPSWRLFWRGPPSSGACIVSDQARSLIGETAIDCRSAQS